MAKDYPEPEGGGPVAGDAAAAQRRDGRRQPVPAAALLVLPRSPGRLPQEGRLQLLRLPGPEQVPRHLRRRELLHRLPVGPGAGPDQPGREGGDRDGQGRQGRRARGVLRSRPRST
ncbi:MAG: hypothetical protein MZU79_07385 [Anaerotruncus sp.]|nr:hypothetical protein [Anaerotruncus sp.]